MNKKLLLLLFLLVSIGKITLAQTVPDNAEGRLWRLCKVWGYLKYYSPRTCQINWDSLLRAKIPEVKNAATNIEFNDYMQDMLNYVEQVPPALATLPPAADSNLNLQLGWTDDPVFSAGVRDFLDTFKSRAGRNDSLGCRLKLNDESEPAYFSYVDFRNDGLSYTTNTALEQDRLVLLFYYWNVFNYMGPYRNLSGHNWDTVLLEHIPEAIAAPGGLDFTRVLAKMQSRIDDSHGVLSSTNLDIYLGVGIAGMKLKQVEGRIVVAKIMPDMSGIVPGDELLEINDVPVATIIDSYHDLFATSNESTFYRDACNLLVRGTPNVWKDYTFRNAANQTYSKAVSFNADIAVWMQWKYDSDGMPVWSTLCNGYGYVNMQKLKKEQVEDMYSALKDKPAIVLDVRNYPNGTLWPLAPHFFTSPIISARFFNPNVKAPGWFNIQNDGTNLGTWSNAEPYSGRLYFLVNAETQSQAEYTVQYLSHAPGAEVVGSQTAGADGDVNMIQLQGMSHMFTGLGWYYDDWYQCQRNGIKINQVVAPTIAGIRAGRDEVLESVTGCVTAIPSIEKDPFSLQLYPNPAGNSLSLQLKAGSKGMATVSITDMAGKICYNNQLDPGKQAYRYELDISSLSAGMYLLRLNTGDGGAQVVKFVKAR